LVWNQVQNLNCHEEANDAWAGIQVAWVETITFPGNAGTNFIRVLQNSWYRFSGFHQRVWDTADADFAAIRDTFLNRYGVEFADMDGPVNVSGSQGLRATCMVTNFSRNESLEEAFPLSVTVKPTFPVNPPSWVVAP